MTQHNTGSSAGTGTYQYTQSTQKTSVVPRIVTQTEQIARYFTEDLEKFVEETHIDLIRELDIPAEYASSNREVLFMLFDDLSHLLRDSIITGIHLLLHEPARDPNTHAFQVRYHAEYRISIPERSLKQSDQAMRFNGYLAPPRNIWLGASFSLLIDWNTSANERRRSAHRPEYWFDWLPELSQYDATSLIRYREGGMAFDGATVDRTEYRTPGS
jgi:hypothetical protein